MIKHDVVIVGAGPAGLQLGYFLQRAGRDYIILESAKNPGSFFENYPRHRKLLSINKVYTTRNEVEFNLRHDWNSLLTHPGEEHLFRAFSREYFPHADALTNYLQSYAKHFDLRIRDGFQVSQVDKYSNGPGFILTAADNSQMYARYLVIATGLGCPNIPDIPGIELAEGYEDISINPEDFAGQTVLILGKGNSALETANHLIAHASVIHLSSPNSTRFAWDSHFVGHIRSVNNLFFDSYLLKSQNGVLDGHTQEITRLPSGKLRVRWSSNHTDIDEEIEQFEYDRVIRCTGFRFDDSIFADSCRPQRTACGRLPRLRGNWESVNVPDLYFAGTLMQELDYKRSQSSFIHGFRYAVRTLFHILEQRDQGVHLPCDHLPITSDTIADKVLERANQASSLWQLVGFMCDVLVLPRDKEGKGSWYYDLNHQYVRESAWAADGDCEYYTIAMGYGPFEGTVFNHPHVHPHQSPLAHGDLTTEIHPILRRFRGADLQAEYHVRTDFLTDWSADFYRRPLVAFLDWNLAGGSAPVSINPHRRELIRNDRMRFTDVRVDGTSLSAVTPNGAALADPS